MFACEVHHLRDFGFRDLIGKYSALPNTVMVNMKHDSRGGFMVLVEEPLQHVDHELHRRVVVIEDQNPVETRSLGLRFGFGDDRRAGTARFTALLSLIVPEH